MESRLRDGELEAEQQRRSLDALGKMAAQQGEELRESKVRTEADGKLLTELNSDLRRRVEELEDQSTARAVEFAADVLTLQSRLNLSESAVDELKKKNTAMAAELPFLQTRLRASESTVEQLRRKSTVLAVRLCNTESLMEELMKQTSAVLSNSSSASEASEPERRLNVRLEELNTNTRALQTRPDQLQEELNRSAEGERISAVHDQVLELGSRLNSSQLHLDELRRICADQTGRLTSVEGRVDELKSENTALSDRLSVGERQLDKLQTENTDQTFKLTNLQGNQNRSQSLNTALQLRLSVSEEYLEHLQAENTALEVRLRSAETHLEHLEHLEHLSHLEHLEHLEHLQTENTVQSDRLSLMESRLTDGLNSTKALEVRLRSVETHQEHLENHTAVGEAELSAVTARLKVTEQQLDELTTELSDGLTAADRRAEELQVQLSATEATTHQLKTHNQDQSAMLSEIRSRIEAAESLSSGFQIRLRDGDDLIQDLQRNTTALQLQLSVCEKQLEHLERENTGFGLRLNQTDDRLQELTDTNSGELELKVAFSAGLTDSGSVGPFDEEMTLIFSKIITNVGGAYNQTAGVFTAPVRGLYFFSFTAADYLKGYMGLYLYRNNEPIIFNLDLNNHGGYASTSNGVALQLEEGDAVRLSLPASYRLYDDSRNFSMFSGFLLFPL
ncbi:golgin IMH1-like [Acanthopagrus latus]|uniref:golgin IMH1-like n=1 Tax=Acanthopagrus latus TaxID=8177 RepID=UPI00187C4AD3|nr:golgin IMH1-like [Acanthopagrus latus]